MSATTDVRQAVDSNPVWYHTLELAPGVVTPGWFDLRKVAQKLPWPDVKGKRCLDVGTYDGFMAFELERRGAVEVLAVDIPNHEDWDWPAHIRAEGVDYLKTLAGPEKGVGFQIAREALGSQVDKVNMTVYDLSPETVGKWDVVVCGSLMLHLRDPLRALAAIKSVCGEVFLSVEQVDLALSLRHPRQPVARLDGLSPRLQWWIPNAAGHRRMVESSGFEVLRTTRPYSEPLGTGHPSRAFNVRSAPTRIARTITTGNNGVPHAGLLARPNV